MRVQNSFDSHATGTLYLVATPIGNLEDMTYRAVRILGEVDEIAAEDTRRTMKLLSHFNISVPLNSYHEHNKRAAGAALINKLQSGRSIALVSDAGTPAVSDPGYELVREATRQHIPVVSVPGANAAVTALIASGLRAEPFHFYGFLPRGGKKLRDRLRQIAGIDEGTLIFYEAPHRIVDTIAVMCETWGDRQAVIARELTKKHEQFMRGSLTELHAWLKQHPVKGECCLLVEAKTEAGAASGDAETIWWEALTVEEHVEHYEREGADRKTAMRKTAMDRGTSRRDVYQALLRDR